MNHRPGGGYNELRHPSEGRRAAEWPGGSGRTSGLPSPRRAIIEHSRDGGWDGGREYGEERREDWGIARQEHRPLTKALVGGADGRAWREGDGRDYSNSSRNQSDQQWERRVQQQHRYSGLGDPPGGGPVAGVGAGAGMVSTKASNMHNPVDPEELAKIQAKKDSYRRDLEAQVTESGIGRARGAVCHQDNVHLRTHVSRLDCHHDRSLALKGSNVCEPECGV